MTEPVTTPPVSHADHGRSPLSWPTVVNLFIRPRSFFSTPALLIKTPEVVFVAWVSGIAYTLGKIDSRIMQGELGSSESPARAHLVEWLTSSWIQYWLFALVVGVLNGWIFWYLAGWWYRKRLEWSGAINPDPLQVRALNMYQDLVASGPAILVSVAETISFRNYAEAWEAESWWTLTVIVFVFWSCVTSYKAATSAYALAKWKSRLWFLVLPVTVYLLVLGAVGSLYMLAEGDAA